MRIFSEEFIKILEPLRSGNTTKTDESVAGRFRIVYPRGWTDGAKDSDNVLSEDNDASSESEEDEELTISSIQKSVASVNLKKHVVSKDVQRILVPFRTPEYSTGNNNVSDVECLYAGVPTALMASGDGMAIGEVSQKIWELGVACKSKPIVVLLLKSGRFAGGVFMEEKCVIHRCCTRYTVRRGQGKSQSSNDGGKSKAKSMGAQLRRAGEVALQEDVMETLHNWSDHLSNAAIVFLSIPNTMKKPLFDDCKKTGLCLSRDDVRIRRVPLDTKRPSFESVCSVYETLTSIKVQKEIENSDKSTTKETKVEAVTTVPVSSPAVDEEKEVEFAELTTLHKAALAGKLDLLISESKLDECDIDACAGEKGWTPLHYASSSNGPEAAECVRYLLIACHANPQIADSHNRPPIFVASANKVKEIFRVARAHLGEEFWEWDKKAKVGPALTEEAISLKKEKEAEKKRRQRARQKEKKRAEKAAAEQEEQRLKEEAEKERSQEEAKRARAGLKPKVAANACDFCTKTCRKSKMFSRLSFVYCSTDCVRKHQRELMAEAATRRSLS